MLNPFEIRIDTHPYRIKPCCEDCIIYEVFTGTEKLFILEMGADANWKTVEEKVIPGREALIGEIGNAIMMHYRS